MPSVITVRQARVHTPGLAEINFPFQGDQRPEDGVAHYYDTMRRAVKLVEAFQHRVGLPVLHLRWSIYSDGPTRLVPVRRVSS